jgi:hypothetical protein
MAPANALKRQPAAFGGAIALKGSDRIGRTARLISAARRKHLRWPLLPAAGDQDQKPGDHQIVIASEVKQSTLDRFVAALLAMTE